MIVCAQHGLLNLAMQSAKREKASGESTKESEANFTRLLVAATTAAAGSGLFSRYVLCHATNVKVQLLNTTSDSIKSLTVVGESIS